MRFWRGNRADAEFGADPAGVARQFWESPDAELVQQGLPLDRALRKFLTDPAGFNAVWDEADYPPLFGAVLAAWPGAPPQPA